MDFKTILPGTLAHNVAALICEKPDTKLTVGEICERFDAKYSGVDALLRSAVTSNVLSRTRETVNGTTCISYSAGFALMRWIEENGSKMPAALASQVALPTARSATPDDTANATHVRETVLTSIAGKKSKSHSKSLPVLDPATLVVDEGISLAPAKKAPPPWDGVFSLLTKPGQSTTAPLEYQRALSVAARAFSRRNPGVRLAVGLDSKDAGRCRVLREE